MANGKEKDSIILIVKKKTNSSQKNNWFLYVDNIENADERIKSQLFEELINQHITNNRFVFASKVGFKQS